MINKEYYLTEEGYRAFQNELKYLIAVRRKEVALHIGTAADYGDLRENSEYDAAMEEQVFLERRIIELDHLLRNAILIEPHTGDAVRVGSRVGVRTEHIIREFVIVDSHEADPSKGRISCHSPIGSALIGRQAGDVVTVVTPKGTTELVIVTIGVSVSL